MKLWSGSRALADPSAPVTEETTILCLPNKTGEEGDCDGWLAFFLSVTFGDFLRLIAYAQGPKTNAAVAFPPFSQCRTSAFSDRHDRAGLSRALVSSGPEWGPSIKRVAHL